MIIVWILEYIEKYTKQYSIDYKENYFLSKASVKALSGLLEYFAFKNFKNMHTLFTKGFYD